MATTQRSAERFRALWADEVAGVELYRRLAKLSSGERRETLLRIAATEERHADHWKQLMMAEGLRDVRTPRTPFRVRVLTVVARVLGVESVLPIVSRLEAAGAEKYEADEHALPHMAEDERSHGRLVSAMVGGSAGDRIARAEARHRVGAGGALRAGVFGFNDGLVSNVALIMGVAGGTQDPEVVLLAGVAGLLAGAFSMGAGEWVSVRSQGELYEREIAIESEELRYFPEEERDELRQIFLAKGIGEAQTDALVERIMRQPDAALDTLVREELGLDPNDLASPWVAASSSFVTFALGAAVPLIPFLFSLGFGAVVAGGVLSAIVLLVAGAALSIFTGRSAAHSAVRMLTIGAIAAAATYGIGTLIGVGVAG